MKEFKIHCSSIWEIMTNPKSAAAILSDTCKTFCKRWLLGEDFQKKYSFTSKYTKKGNDCEENSIKEIASYFGIPDVFATQNTKKEENAFMVGTCDLKYNGVVYDAKNSYECFTFPRYEREPKKEYFLQVQGYMELYGIKQAKICHILSDAPESLIMSEAKKIAWSKDDEVTEELYDMVRLQMTYSHLPIEERIKVFNVEYDEKIIQAINSRVLECREYISELIKEFR